MLSCASGSQDPIVAFATGRMQAAGFAVFQAVHVKFTGRKDHRMHGSKQNCGAGGCPNTWPPRRWLECTFECDGSRCCSTQRLEPADTRAMAHRRVVRLPRLLWRPCCSRFSCSRFSAFRIRMTWQAEPGVGR